MPDHSTSALLTRMVIIVSTKRFLQSQKNYSPSWHLISALLLSVLSTCTAGTGYQISVRIIGVDYILGYALYMKAIHGGNAKNDRVDSYKIANLIRGGNFPLAYTYPKEMRATRDLLRRRMKPVRDGANLKSHVSNTTSQYNLPLNKVNLKNVCAREQIRSSFPDTVVQRNINLGMAVLDCYAQELSKLEWFLEQQAKVHDSVRLHILRSISGGEVFWH